jgi:hypothetical protein
MPEIVEDQLPHQADGDELVDPGGDHGGYVFYVGRADPQ